MSEWEPHYRWWGVREVGCRLARHPQDAVALVRLFTRPPEDPSGIPREGRRGSRMIRPDNAQCPSTEEHPVHVWADGAHLCAGINPYRPTSFIPIGARP